jgi:hypothetical protein
MLPRQTLIRLRGVSEPGAGQVPVYLRLLDSDDNPFA